MFARLRRVVDQVRALVRDLDPARMQEEDAARLLDLFAEAEKICASSRTLLAARVQGSRVETRRPPDGVQKS